MKIAVMGDIHENVHNLMLFYEQVEARGIEHILCMGDLINAGVGKLLAHAPAPVTMIWGNNDGDKVAITKCSMEKGSTLTVGFSTFDIVELGGRTIFITHYPMLAKPMAKSGDFDAVFYAHNHLKNIDRVGDCIVANPGEISAHATGEASYIIYDTDTNEVTLESLSEHLSLKSDKAHEYRNKKGIVAQSSRAHVY